MILQDHIYELAGKLEDSIFSPAFPERFYILARTIGDPSENTFSRSVAAPTYTTDLGVRFSQDPGLMYKEHLKIADMPCVPNAVLSETLMSVPVDEFGPLLDSIIVFFGDYDVCESIIEARKREILESGSYRTLIQSGVVLGAKSNVGATSFFKKAEVKADSPDLAYTALHRRAAMMIKRFHEYLPALDLLHEGERLYLAGHPDAYRSEIAVCRNLEALAKLMIGETSSAKLKLEDAFTQINQALSSSEDDTYRYSRAARYRSQIAINRAQMFIKGDDVSHAVDILCQNVEFCGQAAPDYLPEALGELSLSEYHAHEYQHAVKHAFLSLNQLRYIGAISAIHTVRKVLIASLASMELTDEAQALAVSFNADPLGLRVSDCSSF